MSRDKSPSNNEKSDSNEKGSENNSSDADKESVRRISAFRKLWEKIMPKKKQQHNHTKIKHPPTPKPRASHRHVDKRPTQTHCGSQPGHGSNKHQRKKRAKSATADLPPRDSAGDITVFEGIRGRSRPAKSKFRKKRKWVDDSDSTKSAIIPHSRDSSKSEKIDEKEKSKPSSHKEEEVSKSSNESEANDRSETERTAITNLTSEDESSNREKKDKKKKRKPSNQKEHEVTKSSNESEGSDHSERTAIMNPTSENEPATRQTFMLNPIPLDARSDNWMEKKPGQTFPDANTLVSALFHPIATLPDENQYQYVAYRYIHGSPVMGRVWNDQGKIAASFPCNRREIRASSADIFLLKMPLDTAGIIYDWRPFTELVVFNGRDQVWQPVAVENRSPGVITVDGVQILGQVDIRKECAVYGYKGVEKTILGPEVHNTFILCRRDT